MSQRLADLQAALVASITEPDASRLQSGARARWLEGRGLDPADLAAMAAVDDTAFGVYRALVRQTIDGAVRMELPRTARLLGERFDRDVAAFASSLPRSHYLRDVAFELVEAVAGAWRDDPAVPPFAHELARHELSLFEVGAGVDSTPPVPAEAGEALALDRGVAIAGNPRLYRYAYPIHELAEDQTELPLRATILLAYRDAEHEVRYLSLSPLAAEVTERILHGRALGEAITDACAAVGVPLGPDVLGSVATLLADFAERGIVVGSATGSGT